jgi:AcrR family transcriptional regulator
VTERLSRKERQAHTRARLMLSAASIAAQRGLERASLDAVAEHAGFTKGAV